MQMHACTIILISMGDDMKTYEVKFVLGEIERIGTTNPTTIKELWYAGLSFMRFLKGHNMRGRFIVKDAQTKRTLFMLYIVQVSKMKYAVRLAHVGYGKTKGEYFF